MDPVQRRVLDAIDRAEEQLDNVLMDQQTHDTGTKRPRAEHLEYDEDGIPLDKVRGLFVNDGRQRRQKDTKLTFLRNVGMHQRHLPRVIHAHLSSFGRGQSMDVGRSQALHSIAQHSIRL